MAVSLAQGLSRRPEGVDAITDQEVQHEIERVLREQLLFGSERELPIDSPLGELGLDSLALLHLILAVEETFGVHLPDNLLVRRDPLSMRDLIDMVVATPRTHPGSSVVAPSDPKRLPPHLRMERLHRWLAARGWLGERVRTVATLAWHAKRFLFERSEHYVMERRLDEGGEPTIEPPPGVDLRSYESADQDLMAGLWPDFEEQGSRRELQRWLADGVIALVAVEGSRVVALDVVSTDGNRGEVELSAARHACWGVQLVEAPDVRGRGIGLALLAYSLSVSRARGFRAQLATVESDNAPMIAACTQLLGFHAIGVARRRRIFGVTRWSWELEGLRRRGRLLSI